MKAIEINEKALIKQLAKEFILRNEDLGIRIGKTRLIAGVVTQQPGYQVDGWEVYFNPLNGIEETYTYAGLPNNHWRQNWSHYWNDPVDAEEQRLQEIEDERLQAERLEEMQDQLHQELPRGNFWAA